MYRLISCLTLSALALFGCQAGGNASPAPTPKAATAKSAPAAPASVEAARADTKAAPQSKAAAEANYSVRILPGEAKAGQEAHSVVEVTPAPGYKMNEEFPCRVKNLKAPEGVAWTKEQLGKDDAELTTKVLRFKVPFTAAAAGTVDLSGMADFSVCNERSCKLIRDEKLAWQVDVKTP